MRLEVFGAQDTRRGSLTMRNTSWVFWICSFLLIAACSVCSAARAAAPK